MSSTDTASTQAEEWSQIARAKTFLGREFLTWLWYRVDTGLTVDVRLPNKGGKSKAELWIDDRILLESEDGSREESLIRHGNPGRSVEAAAALGNGKTVKELKLGMAIAELGEFTANLSHDQAGPRSLRLPQSSREGISDEELLEERIELTNTFLTVLDELFLNFIDERTDAQWQEDGLKKIRNWIGSKTSGSRGGTDSTDGSALH